MSEVLVRLLALSTLLIGGCIPQLPEVKDPCAKWQEPGLYDYSVDVDGKKRKAYISIPNSVGPRTLVFVLHGGAMSRRDMAEVTKFIPLSDSEGFVAVFPKGTGTFWNSWSGVPERRKADDVAFLDKLVSSLEKDTCGEGVLATGFSAGAHMAQRWGCEGKNVDAVVTAAGLNLAESCSGDPVPIRSYNGLDDPHVPFEGGDGTGRNGDFISVDESMAIWRKRNECSDEDSVIIGEEGPVSCEAWNCAVPTELCTIENYGHAWPGGTTKPQGGNHDATAAAWAWFNALETSTTDDVQEDEGA